MRYAWQSIVFYRFYTAVLFIIILVVILSLLSFHVMNSSFEKGITNVENKLGADIIITSKSSGEDVKEVLFVGTPVTAFFDNEIVEQLGSNPCIEKMSSQLFVSSLDSECCDSEVQIIVCDDNDFLINPWLENNLESFGNREVIVGSDISYEIGDVATFYGYLFNVVGKLQKTDTGYDSCVFLNRRTGKRISRVLQGERELENKSSILLIKLRDNASVAETEKLINEQLKNTDLVARSSSGYLHNVAIEINNMRLYAGVFVFFVVLLSGVAVFSNMAMWIERRKKEFNTFIFLGINETEFIKIVCIETVVIVSIAVVAAFVMCLVLMGLFKNGISYYLKIPMVIETEDAVLFLSKTASIVVIITIFAIIVLIKKLRKRFHS